MLQKQYAMLDLKNQTFDQKKSKNGENFIFLKLFFSKLYTTRRLENPMGLCRKNQRILPYFFHRDSRLFKGCFRQKKENEYRSGTLVGISKNF